MPSKRKKKQVKSTIHEIPCTQEDRLIRIEETMGELKESNLILKGKLDNDYKVINRIDERMEKLVEGNSTPGIVTRVSNLEQGHQMVKDEVKTTKRLLWTIIILTFGGLLTGFVSLWPKA